MNLHTPERQAHETQAAYRARQAKSKEAQRAATRGPKQAKFVSQSVNDIPNAAFWWLGQHTNPTRNAERKLTGLIGKRAIRRARIANRSAA